MSSLELKVKEKKAKEGENPQWEGTISVPGLRPAKLTKKDGNTDFGTKASVLGAAKRLAEKLGFEGVQTDAPASVAKQAAKSKSKTASKKKTTPSGSSCTESTQG